MLLSYFLLPYFAQFIIFYFSPSWLFFHVIFHLHDFSSCLTFPLFFTSHSSFHYSFPFSACSLSLYFALFPLFPCIFILTISLFLFLSYCSLSVHFSNPVLLSHFLFSQLIPFFLIIFTFLSPSGFLALSPLYFPLFFLVMLGQMVLLLILI